MSCAVAIGRSLWLAHDETLAVERLTLERTGQSAYRFAGHRRFDLRELLAWPARSRGRGEAVPEADLEGIAYADGYLWIVGSHSALRAGAKGSSTREAIEALAKVRRAGNRFVLARIPMAPNGDGADLKLVKQTTHADGRVLRAAMLAGGRKSNALTALLEDDPHLAPFLSIPSKDNGFDIEGIAVAPGGRVFLGLRGPVIDGWACVLELSVDSVPDRRGHLQLRSLPQPEGRVAHALQEALSRSVRRGHPRPVSRGPRSLRALGAADARQGKFAGPALAECTGHPERPSGRGG